MDYIEARVGDDVFYIEQGRVRALVERPRIFQVPGAASALDGISVFKGSLVAYIRVGSAGHMRCGVVFDSGETGLYGIAADDLWDANEAPGQLQPVMTGVWVLDDGETGG